MHDILCYFLVFVERPVLVAGGEDEVVVVETVDFQTDVGEGPETEVVFYCQGIYSFTLDGDALNEKAVAAVLEIAINLTFQGVVLIDVSDDANRSGESDEFIVGTSHFPIAPQVAGFAAFLTRSEHANSY